MKDTLFEWVYDELYPSTREKNMRTFKSGATRDNDEAKLDYDGFLSPGALKRYAEYMHKHRVQADGKLRDSDNWQMGSGIPLNSYMKSLFRHVLDVWHLHRGLEVIDEKGEQVDIEDAICASIFNSFGYLHEYLKIQKVSKEEENCKEMLKDFIAAEETEAKKTPCCDCKYRGDCPQLKKDDFALVKQPCESFVAVVEETEPESITPITQRVITNPDLLDYVRICSGCKRNPQYCGWSGRNSRTLLLDPCSHKEN